MLFKSASCKVASRPHRSSLLVPARVREGSVACLSCRGELCLVSIPQSGWLGQKLDESLIFAEWMAFWNDVVIYNSIRNPFSLIPCQPWISEMLLIFRPLGSQQLYLAINSVAIPLSEGDRACSCLGPRSPVVQKASPVSGEPHVAMDATAQHSYNGHATWLQLDVASSSFATRGAAEFYLKAPKGNWNSCLGGCGFVLVHRLLPYTHSPPISLVQEKCLRLWF